MKIIKWVLVVIFVFVLLFLFAMFNPLVFLPHKPISITLPFRPEVDSRAGLIPMGEKFEHNESNGNPDGHAGIDFGWTQRTAIIASHDGTIMNIHKGGEGTDITLSSGAYKTVYKELGELDSKVKLFAKLKQGDLIGYPKVQNKQDSPGQHQQLHWEFSSTSMTIDRLCPMYYFDAAATERINKIWAAVPQTDRFKINYPDICSGVFKGKKDY